VTAGPLAAGLVLGGRHARLISRRPSSVVTAVLFPLVFTLLFFTVFERAMARAGIDYAQYLLPAVVVQAMFFAAMSSSLLAAEDAAGGMLGRLRSMPVHRAAPFVGLLMAEALRGLVSLAVVVPVGMLLGFRFEAGPLGAVAFLAIAEAFVVVGCAGYIALGLRARNPEVAQATAILPYFPLLLVSNAFSPTRAFPGWLQPVVRNQPVSQVIDALRAVSTSGAAVGRPLLEASAWLVPLLALFTVAATRAFGTRR
jgi:ABC-2 type transport system permease protein